MISALKRSLKPHLLDRKCHVYGVGIERTGTTSLCRFFPDVRAWHEPDIKGLWEIVQTRRNGRDVRQLLRKRDKELYLEIESSHLLAQVVEQLVAEFPKSKYVLTVREPTSWLESVLRWELTKPSLLTTTPWKPVLEYYYGPKDDYRFSWMKEHNLYLVDNYLGAWKRHNERVLKFVPPERLLIVWTKDLTAKAQRIADFAGVSTSPKTGRHNTSEHKVEPFWLSDRKYVEEKSREICGETIEKLEQRAV